MFQTIKSIKSYTSHTKIIGCGRGFAAATSFRCSFYFEKPCDWTRNCDWTRDCACSILQRYLHSCYRIPCTNNKDDKSWTLGFPSVGWSMLTP